MNYTASSCAANILSSSFRRLGDDCDKMGYVFVSGVSLAGVIALFVLSLAILKPAESATAFDEDVAKWRKGTLAQGGCIPPAPQGCADRREEVRSACSGVAAGTAH